MKCKFVVNYVDDLIIFSETLEENLQHILEVTRTLSEWNLTVNPAKVKFVYKEIKLLGYFGSWLHHNSKKMLYPKMWISALL